MLGDRQLLGRQRMVRAFFGLQSIKLVGALLGIFAFFVVAILAVMTLLTQEAVTKEISSPIYYENPELKVVQRNLELAAKQAEADFLHANPELLAAQR